MGYNNASKENDEDMIEKQTQQLALTAVLKMIQSFFVGAISCNQSMGDVVDQIRSLSLNTSEEEKQNQKLNDNVSNTKVNKQKKKKSYQGSNDLYEMAADYAILIDSDDGDDDDANDRDNVEDFTALLEQQFADAVMKASGMPESMYNETKNEWDQLEGATEGATEGNMIGPQL